ncbi:retrotransposable element Tf2 [Tanacetum coccineum]
MPLIALLKKNAFGWNDEAQVAFETLKSRMIQVPVLQLPDFNETFIIETDASGIRIGTVLQQKPERSVRSENHHSCTDEMVAKAHGSNSASSKNYSWSAGQLLRKGKSVIGTNDRLRNELMSYFHSVPDGGHSGMQETIKKITALVY